MDEIEEIELFEGSEIELCFDMVNLGFSEFRHTTLRGFAKEVVAAGTFFLFSDMLPGSLPVKVSYLTRSRHLRISVNEGVVFNGDYEFEATDKEGIVAELEDIVSIAIDRSWHKATFLIGDESGEFSGWYQRSDKWSEWYKPVFEGNMSFRIVEWYNSRAKPAEARDAYYDVSLDAFIFPDPDNSQPSDSDDVYKAMSITLPHGARVKVYPIGTPDWTWSIFRKHPVKYDYEGVEQCQD